MIYCNEHDQDAAAWIQNLSDASVLPACHVDSRDIQKIQSQELVDFRQVHLFCGIGGWPLAFQLAGISAAPSVWSGSCPCQPYSQAGKGKGNADERNLWPEMFRLVRECGPDTIFGEQVEAAVGHEWLDGVCRDLESEGYAIGSVVLGAHSVNAPHIRQRLYWVATREAKWVADAKHRRSPRQEQGTKPWPQSDRMACGMVNSDHSGLERRAGKPGNDGSQYSPIERTGCESGSWSNFDIIPCLDNKSRRIESGSFPLAHGIPRNVGPLLPRMGELGFDAKGSRRISRQAKRNRRIRLKGYGNGIMPELAAEFILAFIDSVS